MTPIRPPSSSSSKAARSPLRASPNSSLRCTRSAWKLSFAGCIAWYSLPLASATSWANSRVRRGSVREARARQMASAMRRAAAASVVSPYSCNTRMSSGRATSSSHCHAGTPLLWSNRRSSGPSASGRKPRCASSNCGEEMPRSKSTADTRTPSGPSLSAIDENGAWWIVKRLSSAASVLPAVIASGSMSKACMRPSGLSAARRPRVWPPRPNVASTNVPDGFDATSFDTHSRSSAGVCVPCACTDGRMPVCTALPRCTLRLRPPTL